VRRRALQALLEQTDVRIAEMKKEAYEFKRDIVVGAENFRTGGVFGGRQGYSRLDTLCLY
jgi:hypothetical protein